MARDVWGIVSGLFVLALGVMAVAGLLQPEETPEEEVPVASSTTTWVSTVETAPTSIAAELPGVPSGIGRVLEWNGDVGFAGDDTVAELPPTVAAVLTQYGVPLRVPIGPEGG